MDKNLRDTLQKWQDKSFLPEPYNWKTYGEKLKAHIKIATKNINLVSFTKK